MKILLLNPPSLKGNLYMKELGRCGRKSVAGEVWPQTGLAYIAAVLKQNNHEVSILDAMAENISVKQTVSSIKKFRPKMVILSTSTPTFKNDSKVIEIIKENYQSLIGLVGTHTSVLPEESLKETNADFVLVNEVEYTLLDLINNINDSWKKIKGLCYKKKIIKCNTKRIPVKNLDTLPFPTRNLLPNNKYRMVLTRGKPFATIISSRGCPYKCTFCRTGSVWGDKTRHRSPENIVSEIMNIKKQFGINYFVFMTDTFTVNKKWVIELCNKIIQINKGIKWLCNSRVDTIDKEMLIKMKQAGCISISYGIESGSQKILDLSRKNIKIQDSISAVKMTKEVGISVFAYFILGLPGETKETINQTISFASNLDPEYANFHIATPFPGTEFYKAAIKNKWLVSEDWNQFEEEGSAVISTENISSQELVEAQKKAMRKFYLRPNKIIKTASDIKNLKDLESKIITGLKLVSDLK